MTTDRSRRDLLKSAMFAAAMPIAGVAFAADEPKDLLKPSNPTAGPDRFKGLKVGVASYTFRKVTLEQTIKAIQRVGLHYVSIKDFHLPMKSTAEERKAVAKAFVDAGIMPLSCGNVKLTTDEAASRNAFEYVRDTGAKVMVCAPDPAALPMLEKLVKEFDIKLAIHNHGPEDKIFPSPYEVQKAVEKLDPRIGYCIDVGHTARAGHDPAKAMRDLKDRLYDVHFKDVADLKGKSAKSEIELGRGELNIKSMTQALIEIGFVGHVGFEHEKDPIDPLPGLAESVGYLKGVIAAM
ncbi:sugar phosphate isomerase/epimerase family protein [Humisphaera borealis]|uniref:Sugar phosphate isomerase/epimerase n=1 Tax=Humisphaera borealis TaxID=2807512 RepID=A0A7M2WT59_9BACT|nr:sugar phosphate isomerase/epimerase [Humisphaera borealis]QOV87790.1 sugar phosphate isomerase/epimerase [Humisphaera borealis]